MLDEQKAAELHRLIEGGDWEGVVLAASKFESDASSFAGGSATGSATGSGITPRTFPSSILSTGTSNNHNGAELRREVEELLQQVAPEDVEHMDEMMLEFKGREDELLETLQTMHERQSLARLELYPKKKVKLDAKEAASKRHQAAGIVLRPPEEKKD